MECRASGAGAIVVISLCNRCNVSYGNNGNQNRTELACRAVLYHACLTSRRKLVFYFNAIFCQADAIQP